MKAHITAARLMLKELESLLREPVNLKEAVTAAAALERHLFAALIESIPDQGYNAKMPVIRPIETVLL